MYCRTSLFDSRIWRLWPSQPPPTRSLTLSVISAAGKTRVRTAQDRSSPERTVTRSIVSGTMRVFVRPWNDKPAGWHRAIVEQRIGVIQTMGGREIPIRARTVLFDPYPFDEPRLSIQLCCKRLPTRKYASAAEFRQVYFKAPNELLEYELRAA